MYVIQFMGMISEKLGAIEKYCLELSAQLNNKGYKTVFVYDKIPSNQLYINELESNNASVIELRIDKGIIKKIKCVYNVLVTYKPEIIHCHFNFPLIRIIIFLSWILRVPKRFVTFHSMPGSEKLISRLWQILLGQMSTKLIAVSAAIKNQLVNYSKLNESRIIVVRLGINFKEFGGSLGNKKELRKTYCLPEEKIIIGCVAFHQPIKGIDVLLDAVEILKSKRDNDDFVICQIGGFTGNYINFLKEKARQLKIEDKVIWLGIRENVPEFLLAFDIYCQPSRSEGLPMAIVEAYAAKLPVIATNVGGIPEIVIHNQSGFLVENEDTNDLADKLLDLIKNREKRSKFGDFGFKMVRKKYDRSLQVSELIDLYLLKDK